MRAAELEGAPAVGSAWLHKSGNFYTVVMIANGASERSDEYPVTVVYRDYQGRIWSRPLSRWHESMTLTS